MTTQRKTVNKDMVFTAAGDLRSRGVKPTVEGVRRELGDLGSYSTLTRLLREWWTTQQELDPPRPPPDLPDDVLEPVVAVLRRTVGKFEAGADERIATLQKEADLRLQETTKELDYANSEIGRLEAIVAHEQQEKTTLKKEGEAARLAIAKLEENVALLERSLKDQKATAAADLKKLEKKFALEAEKSEQAVEQAREKAEAAHKDSAALYSRFAEVQAERDRLVKHQETFLANLGDTKPGIAKKSTKTK